ncbi:MAG: AraC family transcriptional regulator [Alteromonadales bacterium]|nr:AraC family transcriptional regulator [Alteromonadales bacterium]
MNHKQRMNDILKYIEGDLDAEIEIVELAEIACYSQFHFQRLFTAYVGQSVYAFKKRLLLERALKQLQFSNGAVTNIALDCGYQSQTSFNKAFKNQFDLTPSQVRTFKGNLNLKNIPLNKMKGTKMNVEIKKIKPIQVVSARATGNYAVAGAQAWTTLMEIVEKNKIDYHKTQAIGISYDDPKVTDEEKLRFDACLEIDFDISSFSELQKQTIAGGKYAVFLHIGSYDKLQNAYSYIFGEWLAKSSEELRDEPTFEVYSKCEYMHSNPEKLETHIYLPIK